MSGEQDMRSRLLAFLAIAVLATGCVAAGNTGPSPNPSSSPVDAAPTPIATPIVKVPDPNASTTPSEIPDPTCVNSHLQGQAPPPTIANRGATSRIVIVATFQGLGTARWNTTDGSRPARLLGQSFAIVTPVKTTLVQSIRADTAAAPELFLYGGTVGCDTMTDISTPTLVAGTKYVFFIAPVGSPGGRRSGERLVVDAWPIDSAGLVRTPLDGAVTLKAFSTSINAAPFGTQTTP
jgi:hypothetical protein